MLRARRRRVSELLSSGKITLRQPRRVQWVIEIRRGTFHFAAFRVRIGQIAASAIAATCESQGSRPVRATR